MSNWRNFVIPQNKWLLPIYYSQATVRFQQQRQRHVISQQQQHLLQQFKNPKIHVQVAFELHLQSPSDLNSTIVVKCPHSDQ